MPEPRWTKRSRQEVGRQTEKKAAKKLGARPHPNSGAGHIKWDASSETDLFEMKDATKSHTLNSDLLEKLFRDGARQGKSSHYIVRFANGIVLHGVLTRD